jgi:teichuronic acid biosynthesis glycosyltransferase TuaG
MLSDKVSIITPSYNSEKFIIDAIKSVIAQEYSDWEMIIVDDCSTDRTCEIVAEYSHQDSRIKLIKLEQNSGPATARNIAITNATGRYIAFLDSDDLWLSNKLKTQINFMKSKDAALSYTAYEKIDENGVRCERIVSVPDRVSYTGLLGASVIGCLTAIYDTKILGKIYMPEIAKRQDHGLWLKILKNVNIAHGLNEPLACLRIRKGSISSNKFLAAGYVWKLYREIEGLSFFTASYYFCHYAIRAFLKSKI